MSKKEKVINLLRIVAGDLLLAIGTSLFILPNDIVNGGVSGLAIIAKNLFSFKEAITIFVLDWALFFLGLFMVGKKFSLRTLVSTIVYPIFIVILTIDNRFVSLASEVGDKLMATLAGALLVGTGLGITYSAGASTGGTDVLCYLLKKKFNIKLSISTFLIDTIILILGAFFISFETVLYGIFCIMLTSIVIEKITSLGKNSYVAHIVSDNYEKINDYLLRELERGTTLIEVKGGLSKKEKTMIEIVFNEKEYYELKRSIANIDPNAFVSIYKTINTYGEGFEEIALGGNKDE